MDGMEVGYQEQLCPGGGQGGKTPGDPCILGRSSVSPRGLGAGVGGWAEEWCSQGLGSGSNNPLATEEEESEEETQRCQGPN